MRQQQVLTGDNAHGGRGVVGRYTKKIQPNPCPTGHTAFFMVDQGIHRHALFKASGKLLGEHTGYLTPFEAELDGECGSAAGCTIEVTLDGGRPCAPWTTPGGPTNCTSNCGGCSDALIGAADDDTDGTGLGGWVGLNGHVSIECRPPIFINLGVGNIIPPRVHHPPVTTASAGKPLTISIDLEISGGLAVAGVQILDNSSGTLVKVAASASSTAAQTGNITLTVVIPAVKLWSPEQRNLYTAVVTINTAMVLVAPRSTLPPRALGCCAFTPTPKIPIISHETGNYNTYPRITSLIKEFNRSGTTIRPYWLTGALDKLNASGLLSEVDQWANLLLPKICT